MSYHTRFTLKIMGKFEKILEQVFDHMHEQTRKEIYDFSEVFWSLTDDGKTNDSTSWDYFRDMEHLSKKYPSFVFELTGAGEKNEDIWKQYWKNGKFQECRATISFEPYDKNKLKKVKE